MTLTKLCVRPGYLMAIALLAALASFPVRLHADTVTGTAFFVTSDGYALTCAHVIKDATEIELAVGGKSLKAAIMATDEKSDIALLKAEVIDQPVIPISNTGKVEQGARVWVLGFPLASMLGDTVKVTGGTVSGISVQGTQRTIQIDAAVNPGNSGGPLLNDKGVVVGIVNAKIVGSDVSGVGFAIPTSYAMQLLRDQGASLPSATGGAVLDGPTLTKRASPAVALVRATVPLKGPRLVGALPVGQCESVSFSADGKTLICAGGNSNKATIWDVTTATVVQSFVGITREDYKAGELPELVKGLLQHPLVLGAAFSPDGRLAVCDSGTLLKVWDVGTGKCVRTLVAGLGLGALFAFSADGQWLLHGTGWAGLDIQCLSTRTNEETALDTGDCSGISVSPDSKFVAVCYGMLASPPHTKGTVEILELPKGKLVRKITGSRAYIHGVAYAPDGRRIAGTETDAMSVPKTLDDGWEMSPGVVTIWDSESGSVMKTIQCPGMSPDCLQYSPDGKLLAVQLRQAKRYSKGETMVRAVWLYDTATSERVGVLVGFIGKNGCCQVFSPDGKLLALCGTDQTATIWQVR